MDTDGDADSNANRHQHLHLDGHREPDPHTHGDAEPNGDGNTNGHTNGNQHRDVNQHPPNGCDSDGVCEAGENCTTCPSDCPSGSTASCGNGICEAANGENCVSCPADCRGKQSGKTSGRYCCGDGDGQNPRPCSYSQCTRNGFRCTDVAAPSSCCGDGSCTGSESGAGCPLDCG